MNEEQYSIACLIVGILSCVLCCMCFGLPLGIVGIVLFVLSTRNGHGIDVNPHMIAVTAAIVITVILLNILLKNMVIHWIMMTVMNIRIFHTILMKMKMNK